MSDSPPVHRDAFWMLVGDKIGTGMSREVWTSKMLPECVIKVENASQKFQNVIEWETWERVKDTKFAKWFAPCMFISPCGIVLVQKMTQTIHRDKYPKKMPVFLGDYKRTNYGMIGKQIVCHDYGTNLLIERGLTPRMRVANWWDA